MKDKLKVLQLGSASGLYGAERWILSLIKNLDPEKIHTSVCAIQDTSDPDPELCIYAEKAGFATHIVKASSSFSLSAVRDLRNFIVREKINIVHSHGYKTDLIGVLATIGTDCRTLSTPHGWTEGPDIKLWLYEHLDRLLFVFFDAIAPLSQGLYAPLSRVPVLRKKLHLIENGVDIEEVTATRAVSKEIQNLRNNSAFIIGYIGRLTPGKDLATLLHALSLHSEPHWHIALVGEGEQTDELQALAASLNIADRVHFFGFRIDRLEFLNGFDVFVLPSLSEGTPRCLMESMVAKIPIVASDIPGCRNLVDGEKTGLLFTAGDPQELASKLRSISAGEIDTTLLTSAGEKFIHENFSAARMAMDYQQLFFAMDKNHI